MLDWLMVEWRVRLLAPDDDEGISKNKCGKHNC